MGKKTLLLDADVYNGGNNHEGIAITTMDSTTPTMEFGVEYDD